MITLGIWGILTTGILIGGALMHLIQFAASGKDYLEMHALTAIIWAVPVAFIQLLKWIFS